MNDAGLNTDKEIWRKMPDDYYSPSIHVTDGQSIGISVGGHVLVAPVEQWHEAGEVCFCVNPSLKRWRWKMAMWLLKRDTKNKGDKQ